MLLIVLSLCVRLCASACEHKLPGPGRVPVQIIDGVREKSECVARSFQSMNHVSSPPGCQPQPLKRGQSNERMDGNMGMVIFFDMSASQGQWMNM